MRPRACLGQGSELPPRRLGDVEQRAERPRGEQPVARAREDTRGGRAGAELPQQRRLPDTCLPADEHDAPGAVCGDAGQTVVEQRELLSTLEELA